jgi:hypothetical protein
MIRRSLAIAVAAFVSAACAASGAVTGSDGPRGIVEAQGATAGTGATEATGASGASPSPSTSPSPSPSTEPAEPLPAPDELIPAQRGELARVLELTFSSNRDAITAWYRRGDPATWPPPRDVVLLTLYEQRIYRWLASRPSLSQRIIDRLSRRVAREAGRNVAASHALFEHFAPVSELPDFRIRRPEPADVLLSYFQAAERRFGVDWEVLAAIMLIETRMGRIRSSSSAGAEGPMQFIPSTWDAYGLGGDVHDPEDAVMGAANYLRASGAPDDYQRALYAYNHVDAYVKAVWAYARTMMLFPDAYYAYYNWQVYVRTVDGDVRLSGPGL